MSKGAERVLKALQLWGSHRIILEHHLGERLRLDFYIKSLCLAFECDGTQHDEFSGHFHGSAEGFAAAKLRDRRKEELCSEQGITLVRLKYDEVMSASSAESLLGLILERTKESRKENKQEEEW